MDERDGRLVAKLGTLQHDLSSRYILDLALPKRADGKYIIAQLQLTYDLGTRESSGQIPLEISYTAAGNGYVNAEVMKHIDDIQLKSMSDTLQELLQQKRQARCRGNDQERQSNRQTGRQENQVRHAASAGA